MSPRHETQQIFHKILLIQNNLCELTSECVMNHRETSMHHKLWGKKDVIVDVNVSNLRDFVRGRANPFIITFPSECTTGQVVNDEVKYRLLKVFENGEKAYHQYR